MVNYITASVGIILAFSWAIFLLNAQRDQIISLKAQLAIEQWDTKNLESNLTTCSEDVDFLKQGLEEVIAASKRM